MYKRQGLIAFCAALYFGTLTPMQQRLAELEARGSRLEAARGQGFASARTPEEELERFYAGLAAPEALGPLAERVFELARGHGILLRQGSYRVVSDPGARFVRYEISYQGQAPYYRLRLFLRELLREMPMVALDGLSLQRQSVAAPAAEAAVKLSFLVRRP